jgi:hypothetical protein
MAAVRPPMIPISGQTPWSPEILRHEDQGSPCPPEQNLFLLPEPLRVVLECSEDLALSPVKVIIFIATLFTSAGK